MTKIMLVEDDNNLREIYEARLAAEGYDIVSAGDGEAALALAGKERPDMIISDVMMPKISGFEMLDILRNTDNLRDVKIIMLTALGQAEDAERANHLGADRYLVKSQVTLEDIVDTTHTLLNDREEPAADVSAIPASPAETDVEEAPAAEPAAVAAVPEAPAPVVPESAPSPAANAVPDAEIPIPVAEPTEAPVAVEPAAEPAASPSISIPVADGPSDDVATTDDATDDTAATDTPAEPAAPATPPIDYTSPENFNKFQAAPASPVITSPVVDTNFSPEADAEPAADNEVAQPPQEEASSEPFLESDGQQQTSSQAVDDAKATIDDFLEQQDASQPDVAANPVVVAPENGAAGQDEPDPAVNEAVLSTGPLGAEANNPPEPPAEELPLAEEPSLAVQPEPSAENESASADPELHPISNLPIFQPGAAPLGSEAEQPDDSVEGAEPADSQPASEETEPAFSISPDPLDFAAAGPTTADEPASAPDVVAPNPISIPVTSEDETSEATPEVTLPEPDAPEQAAPESTAMSDPFASTRNRTVAPTDEPVPEELDGFENPTIESGPATEPTDKTEDDALVAAALKDLEKGAAGEPSEPDYGEHEDKKVITPGDSADKPDIDRLLELEAAKSGAQQAASATVEPKVHVDNLKPSVMPDDDGVVPAPPEEDE